jgi:hypothetical protein
MNAYDPFSTRIANNLPEVAQSLELARDAATALGLDIRPVAPSRVWMADIDFDWYCKWTREEEKKIKIADRGAKKKESVVTRLLEGGQDVAEDGLDASQSDPITGEFVEEAVGLPEVEGIEDGNVDDVEDVGDDEKVDETKEMEVLGVVAANVE